MNPRKASSFFEKTKRKSADRSSQLIKELSAEIDKVNSRSFNSGQEQNDSLLALALLHSLFIASTPQPEKDEPAIMPNRVKEQLLKDWLVSCRMQGIENPLKILANHDYKKYSFPGKSNSLTQLLASLFGDDLLKKAIQGEKSGYKSSSFIDVNDAVLQRTTSLLQKSSLRETLIDEPIQYLDQVVIPAVNAFLAGEDKAENYNLAKEFVKKTSALLENSSSATAKGGFGRSLNNWEPSEHLLTFSHYYETYLLNTLTEHFSSLSESQKKDVSTISDQEYNYITNQVSDGLNKLWSGVIQQACFSILDEVLDPETGKIRQEILKLILSIQKNLPEDHQGRQLSLEDEAIQQQIVLGLVASLFTNIYFAKLMDAPTRVFSTLAEKNELDKSQFFGRTVNIASSRVLEGFNNLMQPTTLQSESFQEVMSAWKAGHDISNEDHNLEQKESEEPPQPKFQS